MGPVCYYYYAHPRTVCMPHHCWLRLFALHPEPAHLVTPGVIHGHSVPDREVIVFLHGCTHACMAVGLGWLGRLFKNLCRACARL